MMIIDLFSIVLDGLDFHLTLHAWLAEMALNILHIFIVTSKLEAF